MNQQNLKTLVQKLFHKARTRHNHFPFGLIISQGHNSFEYLFEAYSELWRKGDGTADDNLEELMAKELSSSTSSLLS